MDIPLPGDPEPVFLIPTPDSPKNSSITSCLSNNLLIPLPKSPRTETFFSDIPMPDEKPVNHNPLSRYSPTGPFLEDDPPPGRSPTTNHNNRFLVLGKAQAKKRLLAFSATKQAGGAGLTFNLPKKTIVKPNLAKGFEQLTEDGDVTPDAPIAKKKTSGKKGTPKEDKAKAVVSAIEEIKREELLMRGAFRMAVQSSNSSEAVSSSLKRPLDRKKEEDDERGKESKKQKKSSSRKSRSSSDKKSDRRVRDQDKYNCGREKDDVVSSKRSESISELCVLPDSWAEFRSQKMDFDQIKRAKRELKKKSSRSSRSKETPVTQEQLARELCNPFDYPSRQKEPLKAVGARQRDKLYSQDTLRYTKSSPVISYSVNPDIPSSRYRNRNEIFSFAKASAIFIMQSIIESKEKDYVQSFGDEATNLKSRLWYDSSEVFMKPKDSDISPKCSEDPSTMTEIQPSSGLKMSELKQLDHDTKEMDSDTTIPDTAPSKWDSEFEEDPAELSAAGANSLTTNIVPDSSVNHDVNHEDKCTPEVDGTQTNGLPVAVGDTPDQSNQSAVVVVSVVATGSDPYLVNEYEEFMKSVGVNPDEASVGSLSDKNLPTDSENKEEISKKNKGQRVDSEEALKSISNKKILNKKLTARKVKGKRRSKVSKKVRKDSTSSSPVSSDDNDVEVKPRLKRRKIKTKKNKLRSSKKSKKRKRRVSTSSSDEITSSSESSDSSLSDSSLENSSSSEEQAPKKRVKKVSKKKKGTMKKGKQKKEKSNKKKARETENIPRSPAKTQRSSTHSNESVPDSKSVENSLENFSAMACPVENKEVVEMNPEVSVDPLQNEKSLEKLNNVSKFPEKFSSLQKAGHVQSVSVPLANREDHIPTPQLLQWPAIFDGNVNSHSDVKAQMGTSINESPRETNVILLKGNEKYEIDSVEDGNSSDTIGAGQLSENRQNFVEEIKPNFSRLDVITAEAWENDSQEKLENSKKLKYGGEWEDSSVNWFMKSLPEEQVKPSEAACADIQNTSSLSDDLHQEVGKRSLRELKYLRDVIKNEVVDEGATLESPPVKPGDAAERSFKAISLVKTSMVTSFVKDFSERTDFLPVAPPNLEKVPLASDLYSPGQEDDKSSRSSSPELLEKMKSELPSDSPDPINKFDSYSGSDLQIQKKPCDSVARQFLSLGNIPLPPKSDLDAIEVPTQTTTCDLQSIEIPAEPTTCFPSSLESATAATNIKSRTKETLESSCIAKTKHVITVKLLPSELRFKSIANEPSHVTSAAVDEILPQNDGKTVWKAIGGGPNETAVPTKPTLKRASRWNSVPCDVIANENLSSSMKSSGSEIVNIEVPKDALEIVTPLASVGVCESKPPVTKWNNAAVNEVSSSVVANNLGTSASVISGQALGQASADTSLLTNIVPLERDESSHSKANVLSELPDRDKDPVKRTETRDRDNSRSRGSRSREVSKRRDNREKDSRRKEDRSKEDSRKGDRGDSRSRSNRTDSRRDRKDLNRSRDDRRRSLDRNDSRHLDKHRSHGRDDELRSPGSRKSKERLDRRRRSRSRENSRSSRRSSRKRSPNHDRLHGSENKDDGRSSSHKSSKDTDKRRNERGAYNANGDSLINIPLPDIQHHGRDDCGSMDMECCSPVSNFSPLVGLKRSVADSTTISDEELKLANCEQKSSMEGYSKECYSFESRLPNNEIRNAAVGNVAAAGETEFSPKRLSLDERLELELGLRMSPRQQQEQTGLPDGAQYQCYWQNQPIPPDGLIRAPVHMPPGGPQTSQFVGTSSNYYGQPHQQRLHNFTGPINSPHMPTNPENSYPPNVRWDHLSTFPGMNTLSDRSLAQQVIIPEKQFIATVPMDNYINGPSLPVDLVNRPLPGARPLSPRVLPTSIPKVVLIPPIMAVHAQAVQSLVSPRDFLVQPNSIAESEMHRVHKFYPEDSIYADIPSDTEADQKIIEMLSKAKKKSLGMKASHMQKELLRKREILQARELKRKKLAKYKKAILHEGDTLRRSVPLDLEEIRLSTGMQLASPQTSSSDIATFSPVGNFAPLPPASKGILISIGFGVGNNVPSMERRKSVLFADGVRPGEGTSPSAGEDPLSPTSYIPKEKKLRKKKKKIKVHVIRQLSTEDSSSDSESPPPPPPPGSPPPELKPYSFPGPSPGKMILRLSKRIDVGFHALAMGGCRVSSFVLENPTEVKPTTNSASTMISEAYESTCSDEKTLKLIAYHQAMIAIKGQVPFWSPSVPCQTTCMELEPTQLPHSTNIVMKAITTGPVDSLNQGNGNGISCPTYPLSPSLTTTSSSSAPNVPANQFLDSVVNSTPSSQGIFGEPKVTATGERVSTAGSILPQGFGFSPQLQTRISNSPQLHNPPPPPPPLPVSKTVTTAGNPKV